MVGLVAVTWVAGYFGNQVWSQPSPLGGYPWATLYCGSMLFFVAVTTLVKWPHQRLPHPADPPLPGAPELLRDLHLRRVLLSDRRPELPDARRPQRTQNPGLFLPVHVRPTHRGLTSTPSSSPPPPRPPCSPSTASPSPSPPSSSSSTSSRSSTPPTKPSLKTSAPHSRSLLFWPLSVL